MQHAWGRFWRKEGDLQSESSPWGGYLVSIVTSKHSYLLVTHSCHTVCNRVFVKKKKKMVHWADCAGLVPLGYVNSYPISYQAPGIGGIPLIGALHYCSAVMAYPYYSVALFPGSQSGNENTVIPSLF